MKKTMMALFAAVAVVATAQAQTGGGFANPNPGGFAGPGPGNSALTVRDALKQRDDSWVVLQGRIVASLGDEKYTFQDATGSVMVEIDDDEWRGITVTPETNLEISGELDKEMFETPKIDVKSFRVLP
ncbi:MAG: NirD/YgiW/YdeI family stress tolerance protein [Kiritimatiellae bacterium]|nr:NirD/YgiW/YdeI family stress tolerance protein [Kiritimatiellia bacterium]